MEVELFKQQEQKVAKQIVDIPELAPQEKPEKAKYLSQHFQKVKKETQAKVQGKPQPPKETQLETKPKEAKEKKEMSYVG